METNKSDWNNRHKALRFALAKPAEFSRALNLFLQQHAAVHTATVSQSGEYSFEDAVWQGLDEADARCVPPKGEHSIAWIVWHLTRIEDVTMNILVADRPQLFLSEGWFERLGTPYRDTGNQMSPGDVDRLSGQININALRAYRRAVGLQTRENVTRLDPGLLQKRVPAGRFQHLIDEEAVNPEATGVLEYWGGLTVAGLLLMPPTRHNIIHWNEAEKIKQKLAKLRG